MSEVEYAERFCEILPFAKWLNLKVKDAKPSAVTIELPYAEAIVGDEKSGIVHGGAVTALLDTCAGAAVLLDPVKPKGTATIDLRIDYFRPATPPKNIIAIAECYHTTKHVAFVRARAYHEDSEDVLIAVANGSFALNF